MSERTPDQWGEDYRAQRSLYEGYATKLGDLIRDLLSRKGVDVALVETRAKSVDSFVGKIQRKRDKYANPLEEITDLCGVRVITYYLEDTKTVGELLREEFQVDERHSVAKAGEFDPDRFGYVSDHYVLTIGRVATIWLNGNRTPR